MAIGPCSFLNFSMNMDGAAVASAKAGKQASEPEG